MPLVLYSGALGVVWADARVVLCSGYSWLSGETSGFRFSYRMTVGVYGGEDIKA